MRARHHVRDAVRRLAAALRARDPSSVLAAGARATALACQAPDAAPQALAVVDVLLLDPRDDLPAAMRKRLERATEELLDRVDPAAVAERLGALWRDLALSAVASPEPSAAMAERVDHHLATGGTLADLARTLGYSPSHTCALVRQATGQRFSALRRKVRLEHALCRLQQGESVKAAALGSGFSDPSYFTRVFRRVYSVPPSRWREVVGRRALD